jgi:hypothetical protein
MEFGEWRTGLRKGCKRGGVEAEGQISGAETAIGTDYKFFGSLFTFDSMTWVAWSIEGLKSDRYFQARAAGPELTAHAASKKQTARWRG